MKRRYSRKKNSTKIFAAITILAAVIFAASNYFIALGKEVVVAKVNNQKIFKSEVERKLSSVFQGQDQEIKIPEVENLPKEVVEILAKEIYVEREITKEAKKSKIVNSQEIKDQAEDVKNKILRQAYIDALIKEKVTEQRISDKYAELSNDLAGKKEYSLAHIVTKTKEEADKILKELKSKKAPKFADLAKKYSIDQESSANGGDLGYIVEDNMIKEIADVVVNQKNNEISAPIKTKFGWHLVKVLDVRDSQPLPFESVKNNIRDQLIQDEINEINSRITKDIKVEVLVKFKELKDDKAAAEEGTLPAETATETANPEISADVATPETEVTETKPVEENTEIKTEEKTKKEKVKAGKTKADEKHKTKKSR